MNQTLLGRSIHDSFIEQEMHAKKITEGGDRDQVKLQKSSVNNDTFDEIHFFYLRENQKLTQKQGCK